MTIITGNITSTVQLLETASGIGATIIGTSAFTFGLYDIFHLKWTGDLKTMATTLEITGLLLGVMGYLNIINIVFGITLFATFFTASFLFLEQTKNPKLQHEPRKQKQFWQIINEWYDKTITRKQDK